MSLNQDSPVFYLRQRGTGEIYQTADQPFLTPFLAAAHLVAEFANAGPQLSPWEVQQFTPPEPEPEPVTVIPPICQRDPHWASHQLGHSSTTIGRHGCVITCLAMIISDASGAEVTPADVNDKLKQMGLYGGAEKNLVIWKSVEQAFPSITFEGFNDCEKVPAPINLITYAAQIPRRYAIIQIDFYPGNDEPGIQGHYILVVGGRASDGYRCNDPWTGDTLTVPPAYCQPDWTAARAIMRVAFYRANTDADKAK